MKKLVALMLALALCMSMVVITASADETIQCFVPDRGPAVKDVCIDSAGVLTGIILLWFGYNYVKKRSAKLSLEDM